MSRTIAYLAGVIDSDGCITIKRRRVKTAAQWNMQASIFVRQVSNEAVTLLAETFGGSIRIHPSSTPGGRPLFHWEIERVRAAAAAKRLLPYLRIKRRQAEILIEFSKFLSNTSLRRMVTHFQWAVDEPCYTVDQAAEQKGCKRASIYQAIGNGAIPTRLVAGHGRGTRLIPKRFWDGYSIRKGQKPLPPEYAQQRDAFRASIHAINGPTRGIPTLARAG